MKFIIIDWAGNQCFQGEEFESFDEASDFLSDKFGHLSDKKYEEEIGEYSIVEKRTREARYVDPHDPRDGNKYKGRE
jgi:hypothetical protein